MDKHIIFHIEGGIGKNIIATAVAKAIKKAHPDRKLIIVSPWAAVWVNNPDIHRFYVMGQGTPYFYEDFIKGKDTLIYKQEPYHHESFLNKNCSLAETWCKQFGVPYNNEQPELYMSTKEQDSIERKFNVFGKPVLVLQTNGGGPQDYPISWVRDAPLNNIKSVLGALQDKYKVIHVRREDQPNIPGVDFIATPNLRELFALIEYSHCRLFIDSFAQHAARALDRPSVVLWPVDNVKPLGYPDYHINVVSKADQKKVHLIDSYLADFPINGEHLHECPFKDDNLFSTNKIIDGLNDIDESDVYYDELKELQKEQPPSVNVLQPPPEEKKEEEPEEENE